QKKRLFSQVLDYRPSFNNALDGKQTAHFFT
ncbi:unnamed protein product, partial [marine sediment metagenome]